MCDTLFNQNYLFKSDKMEKVVLAFSGGLDTTVCVKLLEEEYDYEVITACVDVGQPREELEKSQNSADTTMPEMNLQTNTSQEESKLMRNMKDTL